MPADKFGFIPVSVRLQAARAFYGVCGPLVAFDCLLNALVKVVRFQLFQRPDCSIVALFYYGCHIGSLITCQPQQIAQRSRPILWKNTAPVPCSLCLCWHS